MNARRLDGRVAVVTAAAGAGIGAAVVRRFAAEGAHVVLSDTNQKRLDASSAELAKTFGRDFPVVMCDVRRRSEIDAVVQTAIDRYGRIDIVFNNAGANKLEPVWEMSEETWKMVLDVSLNGTFYMTRATLPHMVKQKSGVIINMASVAGWIASDAGQAAYCVAKAGVMALTRSVAAECGSHGIRANAIAPGVIFNKFLEKIYPSSFFEERKKQSLLGRLGEPEEVANLAAFLASDEAAYITGEVFCISGGSYVKA